MPQKVHIRRMVTADCEAAAELCTQLGYPADQGDVARRFAALAGRDTDAVFVAVDGGTAVGWIHAGLRLALESDPWVEIGGLVVEQTRRNTGIGKDLLAAAERWARSRGCSHVRVRSRIAREAAHRFYERERYLRVKTQQVFEKAL